ncbi:unnamed protein product, partial [Iphiclides podalirius]
MEGGPNTEAELKIRHCKNFKQDYNGENEKKQNSRDCFEVSETLKFEIQRFVEIAKYFSSPLKKTASYACEKSIVSYPKQFTLEYRRGVASTGCVKFCNLTLEPVYIKYYNVYPEVEHLKFQNLSRSRCRRIPPGLYFHLNIVYNNVTEATPIRSKLVFVATRKTSTPCYQICGIDLEIVTQKVKVTNS